MSTQYPGPRASARSVGTLAPLYRPQCRVPGAPPRKMPTAISSTPSPIRGPMVPRGCGSHRWRYLEKLAALVPLRASIWCAMGVGLVPLSHRSLRTASRSCWLPARLPSWRSGEAGGSSQGWGWSLAGCWEALEGGREKWLCISYTHTPPGLQQLQRWRDDQTELPVRCPQGLFHLLRRGTTREDKTGVTRSLGEGQQFFGGFGGDGDIFNARDAESTIESLYAFARNRRAGWGASSPQPRSVHGPAWEWQGHRRVE